MNANAATLDDLRTELRSLRLSVAAHAARPLLVDADTARVMLGNLSKTMFYRLLAKGEIPEAVEFAGRLPMWRVADLAKAIDKLPRRKVREAVGITGENSNGE